MHTALNTSQYFCPRNKTAASMTLAAGVPCGSARKW
jgi:hypothetical protein